MDIRIMSTKYDSGKAEDLFEVLLEKYPILKDYNIKIDTCKIEWEKTVEALGGNGIETKEHEFNCCYIEITDLEQLFEFVKRIDNELILGITFHGNTPYIEIYDDYREN